MPEAILFICGSLNQTTMLHQVAQSLPEYTCAFTPYYATGLLGRLSQTGALDFSILGGRHRAATEAYLEQHHLPLDPGGKKGDYALVVTGSDLLVQGNIRHKRIVLVQEGMTEPERLMYALVRYLKLPRVFANTAATGLSDAYEKFCVASAGYRDLFIRKGVRPEKIVVTGIPNFDHAARYLDNHFPYHDYVLVATSSIRETFGRDDRPRFLRQAVKLAGGKPMIFKLHPNENLERARREIARFAPGALVLQEGNLHEMIANCSMLVTQYTSAVYTGIALKKEVYSYYDVEMLKRLTPIQNGGTSAMRIAEVCRQVLRTAPAKGTQPASRQKWQSAWSLADLA